MRIRAVLYMVLFFALSIAGCSTLSLTPEPTETAGGEFAIYIPAGELFIDEAWDLAQIELQEPPVLSMDDILSYYAESHVIELAPSVAARWDELELPGKPFVAAVDGEPIYAGAFMAAYFSRSYDGVVILWPTMFGSDNRITIQLGYPWEDFFTGEDPRADPRILTALRQAGKLQEEY